MSDTQTAPPEILEATAPGAAVENSDVADVIVEQVDEKVNAIEKQQTRLKPFQSALTVAKNDVTKLQAASQAATNDEVRQVYEHAIKVAQEIVAEITKGGEAVVEKIAALQEELRVLLKQLAEKDPENPLIKEM